MGYNVVTSFGSAMSHLPYVSAAFIFSIVALATDYGMSEYTYVACFRRSSV